MTFVDSNVFIYAVGRAHPLRDEAQSFFLEASQEGSKLVTSAKVMQELLHAYLPVQRISTLDAAFKLVTNGIDRIFAIDADTVTHARHLMDQHPALTARDLIHLATCQVYAIKNLKTFDRNLMAAFGS
jgi:hypothetical protein